MVRALRGLVLGSRPLRATDLMLANEASAGADASTTVRDDKVAAVLSTLSADTTQLRALAATLEAAVGDGVDEAIAEAAAVADLDQWTADYAEAVHRLRLFGFPRWTSPWPSTGPGLTWPRSPPIVDTLASRWEDKLQRFDDIVADYGDLPLGTPDDERFALLIRAGQDGVDLRGGAAAGDTGRHAPPGPDAPRRPGGALADLGTLLDGSTHARRHVPAALAFAPRP